MGCDIHPSLWVEAGGGKWSSVHMPADWVLEDRLYAFFGLLAGIRNKDVKPIAEPRGAPDWYTGHRPDENCWYNWDGTHTLSWYALGEMLDSDAWNQPDPFDGAPMRETRQYDEIERLAKLLGRDAVLVFYFDS
jgi:hypothetical protein